MIMSIVKKSILQKDIELVSVAQVMLEAARQKMTQAKWSLSEVRRKRDSIATDYSTCRS